MLPRVVIHNSVSLDGSLLGFDVDMNVHYGTAGRLGTDITLSGSNTVLSGFELFGAPPPEADQDMRPPEGRERLPFLVVPDSGGRLKGMLHGIRRTEYFRDAVILASESTPHDYIGYLRERGYRHHVIGKERVDLKGALHLLKDEYGAKNVLVDAGRILGNLLIGEGLATEVSLIVHPVIVGKGGYPIFGDGMPPRNMELRKVEPLGSGLVWMVYGLSGG